MSKKSRLIVLCGAVLCSQYLCAQSRTMGIEEMFRLADENSKSIQTFRTGKEVADENLKAAKAQRLPDISASLSGSYWGNGKLWDRDFSNATLMAQDFVCPSYEWHFLTKTTKLVVRTLYERLNINATRTSN